MENMTNILPHIRWMIRSDWPEVLAIESESFDFPWCEDDFNQNLCRRTCIGWVAEDDDDVIIGFIVYDLHKSRLHVVNIATHPGHRRTGVAKAMLDKLKGKLSVQRRNRIELEVSESNLSAQVFLRSQEFMCVGIVENLYEEIDDDAYAMEYRLDRSPENPGTNRISRMAG